MANPESAPDAAGAPCTIIIVRDRDGRELDRESITHPLTVGATVSALARLRERHQQPSNNRPPLVALQERLQPRRTPSPNAMAVRSPLL